MYHALEAAGVAVPKQSFLDVSMYDTMTMHGFSQGAALTSRPALVPPRERGGHGNNEHLRFMAKDGYVMLATASERTFQDMATAAGRRDWRPTGASTASFTPTG